MLSLSLKMKHFTFKISFCFKKVVLQCKKTIYLENIDSQKLETQESECLSNKIWFSRALLYFFASHDVKNIFFPFSDVQLTFLYCWLPLIMIRANPIKNVTKTTQLVLNYFMRLYFTSDNNLCHNINRSTKLSIKIFRTKNY